MDDALERRFADLLGRLQRDFARRAAQDPRLLEGVPEGAAVALQLEVVSANPVVLEALEAFNRWAYARAQAEAGAQRPVLRLTLRGHGTLNLPDDGPEGRP